MRHRHAPALGGDGTLQQALHLALPFRLTAAQQRVTREAVNVTLGLPIVRTSVDHGTAFDIAGRGVADAGSMVEATLLAARLATRQARS